MNSFLLLTFLASFFLKWSFLFVSLYQFLSPFLLLILNMFVFMHVLLVFQVHIYVHLYLWHHARTPVRKHLIEPSFRCVLRLSREIKGVCSPVRSEIWLHTAIRSDPEVQTRPAGLYHWLMREQIHLLRVSQCMTWPLLKFTCCSYPG